MLHILLTILKVLGIVLAVILGLVLLILLLVLLVPIRYRQDDTIVISEEETEEEGEDPAGGRAGRHRDDPFGRGIRVFGYSGRTRRRSCETCGDCR